MGGRMARRFGSLLLALLLLLAAALRWQESARADRLLDGEARARATLAGLQRECARLVAGSRAPEDFARRVLAAVPALRQLPDVSTEALAYAADDVYAFGVATQVRRDEPGTRTRPGWILRAWPLEFGVTGDREYQLSEDGTLWEGQNRVGRSGTRAGFPPAFPEPEIGLPKTPWWPVELPAHR
jgi:hypothetical protein